MLELESLNSCRIFEAVSTVVFFAIPNTNVSREGEAFRMYLRMHESFSGCRVLSYCLIF
jgi:hypothetical protein